jgi:ubiquinone/menaquinone biosynthesis C-methylase UbiE
MDIYEQEKNIQDDISQAYDSVYRNLIAYESRWDDLCLYLARYSSEDSKLLEIGCGTATLLENLERRGYQKLLGCDLSPATLEVARAKVKSADFKVANMISLPYNSNSIDLAIFMGSLHHLPFGDIQEALKEASRVIKPGGVMIIADSNQEFDYHKPHILTRFLRKLFSIKNSKLRKKLWKFNPDDPDNYTSEHTHKSMIDYINMTLGTGDFTLVNKELSEHFTVQFEGCLFKQSIVDRLFYRLLSLLDNKLPLTPQAALLLAFQRVDN